MTQAARISLRSILCGIMTCAVLSFVSSRIEAKALEALLHHGVLRISEVTVQLSILVTGILLAAVWSVSDLRLVYDRKERKELARVTANLLGSFVLGFIAVGMLLPIR
jgi:hypothetical protein